MATQQAKVHDISRHKGTEAAEPMQDSLDSLLPRRQTVTLTQEAKGVFIPYPLLAMIMTVAVVLGGGMIALYSQISAMNTTLLLRDSTYQADQKKSWEKIEQLQVYIQNDREQLIGLKKDFENLTKERRR
jgi:hypothetical protein